MQYKRPLEETLSQDSAQKKSKLSLPPWMQSTETWQQVEDLSLAPVHYHPQAVEDKQCEAWVKSLGNTFKGLFVPTFVQVMGQTFEERRRVLGFSRVDQPYFYSGKEVEPLLFTDYPLMEEIIQGIMPQVRQLKSYEHLEDPDFVLLNWYRDGSDYIGAHSDDEVSIRTDRPIVSLSLGVTRPFAFYTKKKPSTRVTKMDLATGSLCVMGPGCQTHYKHTIPTSKKITKERWNLTFRWMNAM